MWKEHGMDVEFVGQIKNGNVYILAQGLSQHDVQIVLRLEAEYSDGIFNSSIRFPQDFTESVSWPQGAAQMVRAVSIPISADTSKLPLMGMRLFLDDTEIKFLQGYGLDFLYPRSAKDFEDMFFSAINRPRCPENLYFITQQILLHYNLNVGHRCVTAVIHSYRAIDFQDQEGMHRSISAIKELLGRSSEIPEGRHPRRGRLLLRSSLMTALRHIYLAIGDDESLLDLLKSYTDEILATDSASPIACVNFVPAALMYGFILQQRGHLSDAKAVLLSSYIYFRKKFSELNDNPVHFYEFYGVFECASISLALAQEIDTGKWPGIPKSLKTISSIFSLTNRVTGEKAVKNMAEKFLGICTKGK